MEVEESAEKMDALLAKTDKTVLMDTHQVDFGIPHILELNFNPATVHQQGFLVLDARVVLRGEYPRVLIG